MDLTDVLVTPDRPIRDVMRCIDRNAKGIALVVDESGRLIGTVTDGDIRRAILAAVDLGDPIGSLVEQRESSPIYPVPTTAPFGTPEAALIHLMNEAGIRHVPLLDGEGRVADVAVMEDLIREYDLPVTAVVMAGGFGSRLRPLTDDLPKPMLPVGDKPLLELIVDQLRDSGIRRLHLTTHYKGEAIARHFGDGRDFGVDIRYVEEVQPLGTAGALGLLEEQGERLLVMNGDILTGVDFRAMMRFHEEHEADMTVGVRRYEFRVPYGVVATDGVEVTGVSEKPVSRHFINAGIYLLEPIACRYVPKGQSYDMPELIKMLISKGHRVVSFPIREYWLDIGQLDDYQRALADAEDAEDGEL